MNELLIWLNNQIKESKDKQVSYSKDRDDSMYFQGQLEALQAVKNKIVDNINPLDY